jgi:hypothetical protein
VQPVTGVFKGGGVGETKKPKEQEEEEEDKISKRYIYENFGIFIPAYMWKHVVEYLKQLEIDNENVPFPNEYETAVKDAMKD